MGNRDPEPPPIRSYVGVDMRVPSLRFRGPEKSDISSGKLPHPPEGSDGTDKPPNAESSAPFQLPAPATMACVTSTKKSRLARSSTRHSPQPPLPLPSSFVQHLQANPTTLTPAIGQALIAYADRHSDTRSSHKLKSLLTQYRILPPHHPYMLQMNRSDIPAFTWQPTEPEYPHIDFVPSRRGRRGLPNYGPPHLELKRVWRSGRNSWAEAMWPPLRRLLPRDPARDVVRHVHYLLLQAEEEGHGRGPHLETALGWLNSRPEGQSQSLAMLHLYLSRAPYASSGLDALQMLEIFLNSRPDVEPTCQTLHLTILALTISPSRRNQENTSLISDAPVDPVSGGRPLSPSASFPTETTSTFHSVCPNDPKSALEVISVFRQRWNLPPQLETWRHIAKLALSTDDPKLGQIAWEGWWSTHVSLAERRSRPPPAATITPADPTISSGLAARIDEAPTRESERNELAITDSDHEAVINLRFSHRGTAMQRWLRIVRAFERRAWVRHPEGKGDWDGSMWVGKTQAT